MPSHWSISVSQTQTEEELGFPLSDAVLDAPNRFIFECPEVKEYNQDFHRQQFSFSLKLGSLFLEALYFECSVYKSQFFSSL